jgi:hypothetical protein
MSTGPTLRHFIASSRTRDGGSRGECSWHGTRGRLARARAAVKKHPDYTEHGYFLAVETAFTQGPVVLKGEKGESIATTAIQSGYGNASGRNFCLPHRLSRSHPPSAR